MKVKLLLLTAVLISALLPHTIYADTLTLQPGSDGYDTYIGWSGSTPTSTGIHGGEGSILVEKRAFGSKNAQGLIRFDIPSILDGTTVTDATLGLYLYSSFVDPGTKINIHKVTSSWDESTELPNAPLYDSIPLLSFAPLEHVGEPDYMGGKAPYWVELDITGAFTNWLNGTWDNYGILLEIAGNETTVLFYSSDYTNDATLRPKVEIDYSAATPTPIPGAVYLLGSGLFGLIGLRKKFSGR